MKEKQQKEIKYNLVAKSTHLPDQHSGSTVVAEYVPDGKRVAHYQSEDDLERALIKQLETQAYEYASITSEDDLVLNLRKQLEKLNDFVFSDNEWKRFFGDEIANPNQSIEEKTAIIQENYIKILTRDDGSVKNIYLIRKDNIHDNSLQVINQYATEDGKRKNRYDVTVLVNGLPLVHIELKRRGVAIQEAFNQINRYQRESFWASSGFLNMYNYLLFQTVHIQILQ
jgi:type I restriction enzyme R subunit